MKCPHCRFENPKGMNFCGNCGRLLPVTCPACGHGNPRGLGFCRACGKALDPEGALPDYAQRTPRDYTPPFLVEKVLKLRSTLLGERKIVTVLFADVAGFTGIAEKFDPEDIHGIMDGCFEILGQEIHGAGGTINQYTGDGVMALFGAPMAYEDHVWRSCHAALQVQKRLKDYAKTLSERYGISFKMRIGLNKGPVVVGAIGDNLRLDYTAVGDTTNLAARLQAAAPPGGVLVSEAVKAEARGGFRFQEVGLLPLKGKKERVRAFLLVGETGTTSSYEKGKSKRLPFVNREGELTFLKNALQKALENGPTRVVVVGEAGIGKTRLAQAFHHSLQRGAVTWLQGQCRPFGRATALHPLVSMFRVYFNLSDQDRLEEAGPKIRERLKEESLYAPLEHILDLFHEMRESDKGSELLLEGKKRDLFRAIRKLLVLSSQRRPLIFTLDDMQWADASTRELVNFLIHTDDRASMLLLCLGRTQEDAWCPVESSHVLPLKPLSEKHGQALFSSALGTERLDPPITRRILAKGGGNPLFLIEIGEMLKHQEMVECDALKCTLRFPVEELEVPDTIHGVLAARLDALPEPQKRLVQLAAIIGRQFSLDFLIPLADPEKGLDQALVALEEEGILQKVSHGQGRRYFFRHQLMREVAYRSLLRRDRRRYHRVVGETMEGLYQKDLVSQAPFLAYHFYHAQDWEKAMTYTLEGAHQARQAYACHEALTFVDRALDIIAKDGSRRFQGKTLELYKWKGGMHFCLGQLDMGRKAFQKMHAEAKRRGVHKARAEALFRLGWVSFYRHRPGTALKYLNKSLDMSQEGTIDEIHLKATSFKGFVYAVLGDLKRAKPLLTRALDLSKAAATLEGRAWSLAYIIQYYNWSGDFDQALALSQELEAVNESLRSPHFHLVLHFRQGLIYGALGRMEEAKETLKSALEHLEVGDDRFWRPRLLNTLGWVHAEAGDIHQALSLNRQSLEEALRIGDPETIHNAQVNVGENYLDLDRLTKAEEVLLKTWEEVKQVGISYTRWRYKTRLLIALGRLYQGLAQRDKALYFARKALGLATKSHAKKHQALALLLRARLIARTRPRASREHLDRALSLAEEMGTPVVRKRILHALADLFPHSP